MQALGGPAIDNLGARDTSIGTDVIAAGFLGAVPVLWLEHALAVPVLAGVVAVNRGGAPRRRFRP